VEIIAENPETSLKSGMFAHVRLIMERRESALSIPASAVLADETGKKYVFLSRNGRAAKQYVETGLANDKYVEVKRGISADVDVIYFGLYGLNDGARVELIK